MKNWMKTGIAAIGATLLATAAYAQDNLHDRRVEHGAGQRLA